ncbi:MAG TPA: hypothetical protein VNV87_01770 [Acidimicrobiales bacterium]|jgi:hypothetical protein|nr:hypothetical protein [Acidimicrobiales bacterium]
MTQRLDSQAATTPNRFRLHADLVAELEQLAVAEEVGIEELVARLLVDVLPRMVAEKTERWLRTTLSLAYPVDVPGIREVRLDHGVMVCDSDDPAHGLGLMTPRTPPNGQNPVAGDHRALIGEDFSRTNAEYQHTARPALKAVSGGWAD